MVQVNEIREDTEKRIRECLILKVDLKKDYDSVDLEFIGLYVWEVQALMCGKIGLDLVYV